MNEPIATNPAPQNQTGAPMQTPGTVLPQAAGKVGPSNIESTQNSLQISEIRDGIVILNDGTFRAVIMCRSINFDLMSPQEREAVEFSFQGFLNSLYFPVQIFVRSQKIDLQPYLQKLEKAKSGQANMLLALLMEDYVAFLSEISQQTNIMDKKFYMVIQYPDPSEDLKSAFRQSTGFFSGITQLVSPNKTPHVTIDETVLENAKTELRNRVQAAMQGLRQCGVQSVPLDTQELIEMYYDAYNPDTATRQQLKSFEEVAAPVITRAAGPPPQSNQIMDGA
jgi:hypothetical protein